MGMLDNVLGSVVPQGKLAESLNTALMALLTRGASGNLGNLHGASSNGRMPNQAEIAYW